MAMENPPALSDFKPPLLGVFIFSDFLFIGTKNWYLSQINFRQKYPKAAIVSVGSVRKVCLNVILYPARPIYTGLKK